MEPATRRERPLTRGFSRTRVLNSLIRIALPLIAMSYTYARALAVPIDEFNAGRFKKRGEQIVNPEKSLTAIHPQRPARRRRAQFPLRAAVQRLDIVRKTLGQHEIATIQTMAIDSTAGMVNLTTTLAYASGEWIASDWPVCPISKTAPPSAWARH